MTAEKGIISYESTASESAEVSFECSHVGIFFGINLDFWETAHPPLPPKSALTLSSHLGENVALRKGLVGSFPETLIDSFFRQLK